MKNSQNWKDKLDSVTPQPTDNVWDHLNADLSEENFRKKLNIKIEQISENPSPKVWTGLHHQLTLQRKPQGNGLLLMLMATAALLCIAIGMWWLGKESPSSPTLSSSNIPAPFSIPPINSDSLITSIPQKTNVNSSAFSWSDAKSIVKQFSQSESENPQGAEVLNPLAETDSSQMIPEELIQVEIPDAITQNKAALNFSKDTLENKFAVDQGKSKIPNKSTPKIASIVNFVLTKVFKSSHTKLAIDSGVNSKNQPVWICQFQSPLFALKSNFPQKSSTP
ncbi:MAG: hypothetical protein EBS07_04830 [Sphingobacteriia bacterium]|nr:hypothetical protein [Sphingobacteriia bacterium]